MVAGATGSTWEGPVGALAWQSVQGLDGPDLVLHPPVRLAARPWMGRARLAFRWSRIAVRAAREGWYDYVWASVRALVQLAVLTALDARAASDVPGFCSGP